MTKDDFGCTLPEQPDDLQWVRTRCSASTCAEVAATIGGVWVRSSLTPEEAVVFLTRDEWGSFVRGIKDGDFDDLVA